MPDEQVVKAVALPGVQVVATAGWPDEQVGSAVALPDVQIVVTVGQGPVWDLQTEDLTRTPSGWY